MKKNILFFMSGMMLLCCCSKEVDNKQVEIEKFMYKFEIIGEEMIVDDNLFFPKKMLFLNDSTIAITEIKDDYGVKIFNIQTNHIHLIDKLGHKGEGPNEIKSNVNTIQNDTLNQDEGLWISDARCMQFHSYNIERDDWNENFSKKIPLPLMLSPVSKCFVISEDCLLGNTIKVDEQVFIYSPNEENTKYYSFYPIRPNLYDKHESKMFFGGDMEIKPDKTSFVLAYELFKAICIIPLDNPEENILLTFKDSPFPKNVNIQNMSSYPLQYLRIYTTNQYIYVLYAGKTIETLNEDSTTLSIHVFGWDGTAYCKLQLDRLINCFCVSKDNKILYGINPTHEENSICYRFTLPEFLSKQAKN